MVQGMAETYETNKLLANGEQVSQEKKLAVL